ncbi:hypothetical protein [Ferruginibacter albus]|uniref:hypothetical protein n=1 Tax=Ferruginibacter albus TaxID=2875540 RepID=UPI001CC3A2F9|nr:hypothetical protein [Ferruginibacter albus]UAY52681.1 hypothetical protein K9M53_03060 [Ferruginibacter albus]
MPTLPKNSSLQNTAVEQVNNNTTTWIGHHPSHQENISGGQTFKSPVEGDINNIEIYSSIVATPGKAVLTIYSFDPEQKIWGKQLGSATVELSKNDSGKWINFDLNNIHLHKDETYGFRLECPNSFIGVGETVGNHKNPPFTNGQEWRFSTKDNKAHSFSYFSLAFKVGIRA